MLVRAVPCALLWPAAMITWGPGYQSSTHRHHSVQLVMALEGTVRIRNGPGRKWIECGASLVRPDVPHEVHARDVYVLIAFVDVESDLGAALLDKIEADISVVPDETVAIWRRDLGNPKTLTATLIEPWVRTSLLSSRKSPKIHPAVRRVLPVLREEIGTRRTLSLARMAKIAGLSPSRFMHVFTQSVGVPIRPYILWLRLQRACGEMMKGARISEAAHRAGFSDAAHLTRSLRRMMGTTPRELIARRNAVRGAFHS